MKKEGKSLFKGLIAMSKKLILRFSIGPIAKKDPEGETTMSLVLTDEQKCSLSIQPVTAAGNPAAVDGVPVWSTSNPDIIAVIPADDGMSAEAITVGPVGTSQVSVSCDADLGAGIRTISAMLDVEVIAAEAAAVTITAGTPELK